MNTPDKTDFYPDVIVNNNDDSLNFGGKVVRTDSINDFALILVDREMPSYLPLSDTSAITPLTEVFAAGYPLAGHLIITRGYFEGKASMKNYLNISAPIAPGNSGGPVIFWDFVDARFEVLGVASAVKGSLYETYSHLALVRPVEPLSEFINDYE